MASRTEYKLEILLGAKKAADFASNINGAKQGIGSISSVAKKAATAITTAFAAVNIKDFVTDAVDVYSGFEQQLANSASIAGASDTQYKQMEKASRDAGKATIKTAEESASALGYMALAGWSVEDQTKGLMPVLKLSAATNLDLAETSDLVTDSMSAMNIKIKDMPGYLDMVTQANNASNQTSEQLMQAFIKTGGATRTLGIDAQDTATALGILANNGTKAEEGGRAMNSMLTRIASNKNALKAMEQLKISIFDTNGNFVGLEEALKRINKGISGLSVEDQAKALKEIAGTNYYSKMKYLLEGVKDGANGAESAWEQLENRLEDSDGSLETMYDKMTNTMSGAKETMISAQDDMKISFADAFDGELTDVYKTLGDVFNQASDGISNFASENEVQIHLVYEDIKDGIMDAGQEVTNFVGSIINNFDKVKAGLMGVGTALAVKKVGSGIASTISGIAEDIGIVAKGSGFGTAAGLAIAGIAAVSAGIVGVGVYLSETEKKMINAGLDEHFGDISLSLEDLDDIAQDIVGKKSLTQIAGMLDSIGKTDESIKKMKDSLSTVETISWKINSGFSIDKDDKESYVSAVKNYVKYAQEAVDQQGYSVSIATKLLLGSNSNIGKENDSFFKGLDTQLNRLQNRLNKKIQKAVENGVDINTDKSIQKLLSKVNDITNAVTEAENEAELQSINLKYSGKDLTADDMKQLSKDIREYEKKATEGASEAYKTDMAALNARYKMGDLSKSEYTAESKELEKGYYKVRSNAMAKGADYLFRSIQDAYGMDDATIQKFQTALKEKMTERLKEGVTLGDVSSIADDAVDEAGDSIGLTRDIHKQIAKMASYGLDDIYNDMLNLQEQQKAAGIDTSEKMKKRLADIGTFTDVDTTLQYVISNDDNLAAVFDAGEKMGDSLTEGADSGIRNTSDRVIQASNNLVNLARNTFADGMNFTVTMDFVTQSMPTASALESASTRKKNDKKAKKSNSLSNLIKKASPTISGGSLHRNAKGGIYTKPILTTFAEDRPEMALPLDGSTRAKSLWQHAGKLLGMTPTEDKTLYSTLSEKSRDKELVHGLSGGGNSSATQSSDVHITYAPVINVQGNADEKVIKKVVRMSHAEFAEMMEHYQLSKKRVSFS